MKDIIPLLLLLLQKRTRPPIRIITPWFNNAAKVHKMMHTLGKK